MMIVLDGVQNGVKAVIPDVIRFSESEPVKGRSACYLEVVNGTDVVRVSEVFDALLDLEFGCRSFAYTKLAEVARRKFASRGLFVVIPECLSFVTIALDSMFQRVYAYKFGREFVIQGFAPIKLNPMLLREKIREYLVRFASLAEEAAKKGDK